MDYEQMRLTYLLNENLNELSLVSWLDTGEDLTMGSTEDLSLADISQGFELDSSEARAGSVLSLLDDVELFCDGDSGLLGVSSDHDNINSSGLALSDGWLDLWSDWILDANVAQKAAATLEVSVSLGIRQLVASVLLCDVLHVSTIEGNSDSEGSVSLGGNLENLLDHLDLHLLSELELSSILSHDLGASINHSLWSSLEEDLVTLETMVVLDDGGHSLTL